MNAGVPAFFSLLFRAGALYTGTPLASEQAPGMQAFSICCCHWQSLLAFLAHPHLSSNCLGHFLSVLNFPKGILYISSLLKLFTEVTNWLVCESLGENTGKGNLRKYYKWNAWEIYQLTFYTTISVTTFMQPEGIFSLMFGYWLLLLMTDCWEIWLTHKLSITRSFWFSLRHKGKEYVIII